MIATDILWTVIIALGIGTYLMRFSFLGLIGSRPLPAWVMRHLRYTAVAVIPALVAPLVVWPAATDGALDPARLAAAMVTLSVGIWSRNVVLAIFCGALTLYALLALI